jgi:beta-phosphoglucomutase
LLRAVVFDFDGVIANSEPFHFRAYRDVLAQEGLALTESEYYARYLGYDDVGAFNALAADRGARWDGRRVADLVRRKAARMEELEHDQSVLFLRAEILRVLEQESLAPFFPVLVAAEDARTGKPAPDPYVRAVELLSSAMGTSLDPAECVAVEDSRWGLESARAAGLRTVAVTHTYPAEALTEAEAVISHLDQLTVEFLSKLGQQRRIE